MMLQDNPAFQAIREAFPHIGSQLAELWGKGGFLPYMDTLLQDDRGGKRKGFPADVLFALSDLADAHKKEFPELRPKGDIWDVS